jgi:O-antigen ligase
MFPRLNKTLEKICRWTFMGFILTLPFQTNLLIYQTDWGRGFLNPYLTIALTLPEIFLILAGFLFILVQYKKNWKWGDATFLQVGGLILAVLTISLLVSPNNDFWLHFFMTIKGAEAILLYLLTTNKVLKQNQILKVLISVMTAEALLGILQVFSQSSLGLNLLGEPLISGETPHLARITWGSFTWIRAYGTFPHPNVLGGFLVVSLLATFLYQSKYKYEKEIMWGIQFLGLLMTCSRSALLALSCALILLCFWYSKKMKAKNQAILGGIFSLFVFELALLFWSRGTFPWNDPALLSRWSGYKEALSLFWSHPLGVGWNHYTLFLDEVTPTALQPWDYQPVHNVYLLILVETGLIGFFVGNLALILIVRKMWSLSKTLSTPDLAFKKRIFALIGISVILIGLFDHYWISLEQGRFLLILIWGMFAHFVSDPLHVLPVRKEE